MIWQRVATFMGSPGVTDQSKIALRILSLVERALNTATRSPRRLFVAERLSLQNQLLVTSRV